MQQTIGVRELRDNLTDLAIRVADHGAELVVERYGRSIALLRPARRDEPGRRISITVFRRRICRALRVAGHQQLLITWHRRASIWVGPVPPELDSSSTITWEELREAS